MKGNEIQLKEIEACHTLSLWKVVSKHGNLFAAKKGESPEGRRCLAKTIMNTRVGLL